MVGLGTTGAAALQDVTSGARDAVDMSAATCRIASRGTSEPMVRRFSTTQHDRDSRQEIASGAATAVSTGEELQHSLRVLEEQAAAVHDAVVQLTGELRRFESARATVEQTLEACTFSMPATAAVGLTSRQREIAQRLMTGQSDQEIALALGITMNTVKSHSKAVLGKLRLHSRHELHYILTL
jgi:DNA-binding NarL/FixJ family response regulator